MKAQSLVLEVVERQPARRERRCFGNYASKRICDSCPVEKGCMRVSLEDPLLLGC